MLSRKDMRECRHTQYFCNFVTVVLWICGYFTAVTHIVLSTFVIILGCAFNFLGTIFQCAQLTSNEREKYPTFIQEIVDAMEREK